MLARKIESMKREYERSGYAKIPKYNLPDGVRSRKKREEGEKYSPAGLS